MYLIQFSVHGQINFCGTSFEDQRTLLLNEKIHGNKVLTENATTYIPLMVHNVSNDNSQGYYAPWSLFETLCTLNEDFKDSGIQFYLEKDFNYIRNSSWNDHDRFDAGEEMMIKNNVKDMANCYLVANPAGNCGYYTYSGDGVALNKSCLGKKSHTWAHEMGHYFSLPHTFYGWEGVQYSSGQKTEDYQSRVFTTIENVSRDNCKNQADRFCDTEPDYISSRWTCAPDGFSNSKLRDTKDSTFRVDGTLFMSYSNDGCMNRFSSEQMTSMNRNIQFSRPYLKRTNISPKLILEKEFELQFPVDSVMVPTSKILFSWEPIANAKYYAIQISRTENFTIVIKNLLLTNPYVEIDSLIQGKNYWWRVRAYSEFDFCGAESMVGFFKTEPVITSNEEFVKTSNTSYINPNPVSSFDYVHILNRNEMIIQREVNIRDITGKLFKPVSVQQIGNNLRIELSYLPDGLYFLTLTKGSIPDVYKMLVKNK